MPAPTFWPMVFAFGLTLLFAGLVTHWAFSVIGLRDFTLRRRGGLVAQRDSA